MFILAANTIPDGGMLSKSWWIFQNNIPMFWYGIKSPCYWPFLERYSVWF